MIKKITAILLVCLAAGAAQAQNIPGTDYKQGPLGPLSQYIGTDNYDAVLKDPKVAAALNKCLGPTGVAELKERLQVFSPIAFDRMAMLLQGNMQHRGGSDKAVVSVTPFDGEVSAAVLVDGRELLVCLGNNSAVQDAVTQWSVAGPENQ